MKTAHIRGLIDDAAKAILVPVVGALEAEGWRVETPAGDATTADSVGVTLLIAVATDDASFARQVTALVRHDDGAEASALAVRVAFAPQTVPPSLPAVVGPVAPNDAIRALALKLAPSVRVNAITADRTDVDPTRLGREIAAAIGLFIHAPSMTGVTIPLDSAAIGRYAAWPAPSQETAPPS